VTDDLLLARKINLFVFKFLSRFCQTVHTSLVYRIKYDKVTHMSVEFKSRILQTNKKRAVGKYDAALWQEGLLAFSLFASHVALSSNV